ncbi:MAG: hypothetical protein GY857_16800, partial [Desulfobacula sp.]|nr:hypothetical protein [Desulfobacula sp.]
LLDHSNLIQVVLPDGLPIPIPTGLKAPDGLDLKEIEFDEHGNCFMNLALDDLDTSAFCFISSANHKSASFFHDFLN